MKKPSTQTSGTHGHRRQVSFMVSSNNAPAQKDRHRSNQRVNPSTDKDHSRGQFDRYKYKERHHN